MISRFLNEKNYLLILITVITGLIIGCIIGSFTNPVWSIIFGLILGGIFLTLLIVFLWDFFCVKKTEKPEDEVTLL